MLFSTVTQKCHDKRKKLPAKEKLPLQKKNARGKKEIGHDKRKKLPSKEKLPRQIKFALGRKEKARCKRKIVAAKESNSQKKTKKYDKKSRKKYLQKQNFKEREKKKKIFANFSRLLRLLCSTAETLICCSR